MLVLPPGLQMDWRILRGIIAPELDLQKAYRGFEWNGPLHQFSVAALNGLFFL
jgi:hypothetical protein